jgi:inosine-uridine nucleoside N-ribohydrolase
MTSTTPSVFDMDIGKDPDDTCVASIVGLNPDRYSPALIITNDETQTQGRARFLAEIIKGTGADIPVAAGLPSTARRENTLVERAGLIPTEGGDFIRDGPAYLTDVLVSNERVNYFGLGALTNLATVLREHPELAKRVNLIQMGPSFQGAYRKPSPQYNVRIDIPSFQEVLAQVDNPRLLMSHASWGAYGEKGTRQNLGIYVDDLVWNALKDNSNSALNLFAEHLRVWKEDGKPCSIMHDPLTVLSFYETLVDYVAGEIIFDESGFADLTEKSKAETRVLSPERLIKLGNYLEMQTPKRDGLVKKVEFSLNTNYDATRHSIIHALFGYTQPNLANQWKEYNSRREG